MGCKVANCYKHGIELQAVVRIQYNHDILEKRPYQQTFVTSQNKFTIKHNFVKSDSKSTHYPEATSCSVCKNNEACPRLRGIPLHLVFPRVIFKLQNINHHIFSVKMQPLK